MFVDPGFDLSANRAARALSVLAVASASAWCAVDEVVLLQDRAGVRTRGVGSANHGAGRIVACPCVVAVQQAAHQGLALLISAGTLAAGAGQTRSTATAGAIILVTVRRTRARAATALLLNVAFATARATNGIRRRILTVATAAVIGIVTDSVVLEFARFGIAAVVASTGVFTAAVTILSVLDDAITTLATCDGSHSLVLRETARRDTVST